MKFLKFHILILVMHYTTNDLSKTLFCIEIHQQMAEISSKECWKTQYKSIKSNKKFVRKPWFFSRFACFSTFFWWYFSHLLADFDAKYRFGKVISCRFHVWNLDVKIWNFHTKVWLRSRNLVKKVRPVTTFSWITFLC
jgi:hypothetical protein